MSEQAIGVTDPVHAPPVGARPIRVMHVVHTLALAGMEYGVMKLLNRLDRSRFATSITCLNVRHVSADALLDPDIPVFELRKRGGRDLGLIRRLARLLREQDVDIVH